MIGGSGSGKSSAILIPTLLSVSHIGLFCIDIKGELWSKTRRLDDDRVVIVDFQDRNLFGWDALAALNRKASPSDQDIREQMEEMEETHFCKRQPGVLETVSPVFVDWRTGWTV